MKTLFKARPERMLGWTNYIIRCFYQSPISSTMAMRRPRNLVRV